MVIVYGKEEGIHMDYVIKQRSADDRLYAITKNWTDIDTPMCEEIAGGYSDLTSARSALRQYLFSYNADTL